MIFRGKIRCVACSLPYSILVRRDCDCIDSNWRRDHEIILPRGLWATLYVESINNSGVVSGVHVLIHCTISAPKPELNCRTLSYRGSDCHLLLHHGVGSLSEPTKATINIL